MKISLEWISDYVALPSGLSINDLIHDLTMTTVEVEGAIDLAKPLENIKVARVASIQDVSAESSLKSISCDLGDQGLFQIVCGAQNLREGMLVPVALPSAVIRPCGEKLQGVQPIEVAGILSEGVICASCELELDDLFPAQDERSIFDLSELSCFPGQDFREAIGWNDVILEIDNKSLTNRPDLWGHYGLARELAAIYKLALKPLPKNERFLPSADLVENIDTTACQRFTATSISNVRVDSSPFWMRSRLVRVGQRPINLMVDLTNFVMLALGQPSHVYDAERLSLPLSVRYGHQGQKVELLDKRTYELDEAIPLVFDKKHFLAVAGIMGDLHHAVSTATQQIILEVANFDAMVVRRASTRLGLRSDASSRFEKAIDTQRVDDALNLFLTLLENEQPTAKIVGFQDLHCYPTLTKTIEVGVAFLQDRLGKILSADEISQQLGLVGFDVIYNSTALQVTVPTWRSTGDVSQPQDIVEEVARLYGYDRFEFVPPEVCLTKHIKNRRVLLERHLKEILAFTCNMQEVISYPWIEDQLLDASGMESIKTLRLATPPAPDQSCLRPSLIPGLLKSVAINLRYFSTFRIFEVGSIFRATNFVATYDERETLPLQVRHLGGALVGADTNTLFLQAKGIIETLRRSAHIKSLSFFTHSSSNTDAPWAEDEACLGIQADGQHIGTIGLLTNRAKRLADIKRVQVVLFEINIDALEPLSSRENKYYPLPEYPRVDFDISLLFPELVTWLDILDSIKDIHPYVREVIFVDQYVGKGIPVDKKSLTLRLHLGSSSATLKSDEVKKVVSLVTELLKEKFDAHLREEYG